MDTELQELSIEVLNRTGWHGLDHALASMIPVYSSDYLLEKLKRPHTSVQFEYLDDLVVVAWYNENDDYWRREADTLLKALLKLVIALDEAKVLTHESN